MRLFRATLWPFSFLLGSILYFRHFLFSVGILSSKKANITSIVIGNLKIGGTGKTPFAIWLIEKLDASKTGFISRGYGRQTKGFQIISSSSEVNDIGDEPSVVRNHFKSLIGAVSENRLNGIYQLKQAFPQIQQVVLDDAFQHRKLNPDFSILLTAYNDLYVHDELFPVGGLRDLKKRASTANAIVVTKCPDSLSEEEQQKIREQLQLNPHQILAFTGIEYEEPVAAFDQMKPWNKNFRSVCFAGLANPIPFFIEGRNRSIATIEMALRDHHEYTAQDVSRIRQEWINFGQENTVLLTTEKDVVKCKNIKEFEDLPLYFLRMKIKFIAGETALLNAVKEVKK
jgi:tetraacyldisaccharide 4'-kinase